MHSALATHLVQIIILKEVVAEPPLHITDSCVWQLDLEDGVLPGGHGNVAELSDDANTFWEWMGGQKSDLSRSSERYCSEVISKSLFLVVILKKFDNKWDAFADIKITNFTRTKYTYGCSN